MSSEVALAAAAPTSPSQAMVAGESDAMELRLLEAKAMTKKRGTYERAPQWWKHLRKYWKRVFWKRDRKSLKGHEHV